MQDMSNFTTFQSTVTQVLLDLYSRILSALPNLIIAIIILLLGWILGSLVSGLLRKGLEAIGIDRLGDQVGLKQLSERSGRNIRIARIVEWVVKWFFILGAIIATADVLNMSQVTDFFYNSVLGYAGHVIIAMAILLLGIIVAGFLGDVIEGSVKAGGFKSAGMLGSLARWSIMVFTVLAALSELQIASGYLTFMFQAFVAMLALAGGLAFGLGGRDHAKKVLDHVEHGITKRS